MRPQASDPTSGTKTAESLLYCVYERGSKPGLAEPRESARSGCDGGRSANSSRSSDRRCSERISRREPDRRSHHVRGRNTKGREPRIHAQAWRVEFSEDAIFASGRESRPSRSPNLGTSRPCWPLWTPSDALSRAEPETDGALTVVWIPSAVKTPSTIERDADEWIRAARRAEKRGDRPSGRSHRAGVMGRKPRCDLRQPERPSLRARRDRPVQRRAERGARAGSGGEVGVGVDRRPTLDLTHAVTRRDLTRQRHVNEMTEIAARMMTAWLRVSSSLEQLDPALADPSKRLFAELVSGRGPVRSNGNARRPDRVRDGPI